MSSVDGANVKVAERGSAAWSEEWDAHARVGGWKSMCARASDVSDCDDRVRLRLGRWWTRWGTMVEVGGA